MRVHVRNFGANVEFEDSDALTYDEEIAAIAAELPKLERVMASRPLHGLSPILDPVDEDGGYEDFDASAFVERTYQ